MIYLNIILTILCIILISFFVIGFILYKKMSKKGTQISKHNPLADSIEMVTKMQEALKKMNMK
jgi:hypothetical protein